MIEKIPVTIYHNPRCSKSRHALTILKGRTDCEVEVVEYLKTPPTTQQLKTILTLLGKKPRDLMRKKEPPYRTENLDSPALSDDDLIAKMIEHPILIERPLVVRGKRAVIARPPENILEIL